MNHRLRRAFFAVGAAALYVAGVATLIATVTHHGVLGDDLTLALLLVLGMTAIAEWTRREHAEGREREETPPPAAADVPPGTPIAVYALSGRRRALFALAVAAASLFVAALGRALMAIPGLSPALLLATTVGPSVLMWAALLVAWRRERRTVLELHAGGLRWVSPGGARFLAWADVEGVALAAGRLTLWPKDGDPRDLDLYAYDERLADVLVAHAPRE